MANKLKKVFAQYINKTKDQHELLLHVLNTLIREKVRVQRASNPNVNNENVIINVFDLRKQAKYHNIHSIDQFLKSDEFEKHFIWDKAQDIIASNHNNIYDS
ncbi:hypothetical protein Glove_167g79 [Diversispora epigaea]|uniref:DNA replication licensing factor MCM2-like winged-helix domain-containing protein n=1 Tax=Diversispora epigaea TaxID=1348612 RepID=A0A397IQE0_9GLOM|nr:hypothetical protein Glove_167g79 [Diversispora epigaea]